MSTPLIARRLGFSGAIPSGRRVSHRDAGLTIGQGFFASGAVWIEANSEYGDESSTTSISLGDKVRASPRWPVWALQGVAIGDRCLFRENVVISDHQHCATSGIDQEGPERAPALTRLGGRAPVVIRAQCHIRNNVVILPGTDIGDGVIIDANSAVRGGVAAETIALGTPPRVVERRDQAVDSCVTVGLD